MRTILRLLPLAVLAVAAMLLVAACEEANEDPAGGTETPPASSGGAYSAPEQVLVAGKKYTATIATDRGDIVIELYAESAPRTVNSFVFLAREGYFDGITFHRVVPAFVVQGGDPEGTGLGGPGYEVEEDVNDLTNTRGMVSMAKTRGSTRVGSQFFINLVDNPNLDVDIASAEQKRFYPFGKVIAGMDVVDQIQQGDVMRSVTITEE
jgi:peptidyl-prolyl cis-trans isomerase B (cyclophilin B)